MTDPRQFSLKHGTHRLLALTSLSWLLPVELTPDGREIVRVHYDHAIEPAASYQEYGVEDARISRIDNVWYMTTCSVSAERHCTTLHVSLNGLDYELKGIVLDHQNKDMILFEGKVGGRFMALTRPLGEVYFAYPEASPYAGGPSINLAQSPDALHWKPLDQPGIRARKGSTSSMKVGGGSQPIRTEPRLAPHLPWRRDARDRGRLPQLLGAARSRRSEPHPASRGRGAAARGEPGAHAPDRAPDVSAHTRRLHHRHRGRRRPLHRGVAARQTSPAGSPTCPRRASHDRALVADGRDLPDLSALLSGHATATASATSRGSSGGSTISPSLGVDAIWISPIYPSPMADFGYDVADYCDVDPRFGTLADFDDLLAAGPRARLKVMLDFVPNHTSDRHPWFVESRSSRDNPKRDWYIWRDPAPDGGPPNNWISDFGGSAWEWDEATGQYYYHAFLKEQPDLNWRNPAVQAAMYDVMRFWFDRGVDGFRIDVLWHMIKAAGFPDNPPNPAYQPAMGEMHRVLQLHSTDQPEVHGIAAEMRAIADSYSARDGASAC